MIYPPLVLIMMVVFFLITLIFLPLLWFGVVGNAFGTLIGADLLNLRQISQMGAPWLPSAAPAPLTPFS